MKEKEIIKLLNAGFDAESIAFEFDIPIEIIKKCEEAIKQTDTRKQDEAAQKFKIDTSPKEVDKSEPVQPIVTNTASPKTYYKNSKTKKKELPRSSEVYTIEDIEREKIEAHARMEQMRENYSRLYYGTNKSEQERSKPALEQNPELVEEIIKTVEDKFGEIGEESLSLKEKRKKAQEMFSEIEKVRDYSLTIEQVEKIISFIESEELKNINMGERDRLNYNIRKSMMLLIEKLVATIDIILDKTDDLEKLKWLDKKITMRMTYLDATASRAKFKLATKIQNVQYQNTINRIKNDIPVSIENIIMDLAQGKINLENANEIITQEAKRRVESKPKTRFSLTEEKERRQILIQIKTGLRERADKYDIVDPTTTIMQLKELLGGELETALTSVIGNLLAKKDFETAKEICDKLGLSNKQLSQSISRIKKDIRNAELGNLVLREINTQRTPEEERIFLIMLEQRMRQGNISKKAISVGKSEDGLRDITLGDIWNEEKVINK